MYLINTCTVTGTGDQKSLKTIRRAAREHPDCAIVVCGCLAQREAEKLAAMDNVRLVLGVQRRGEVVELLERALASGQTVNAVGPLKGAGFESLFVSRHEGKTRATMKIQEGCDRYCSYCIIPSVRGPVRSMPLEDVAAEAARLGAAGYREIVVTGIHLASYGRGTDDTLLDAVRAVHDAPGVRRVRLGSLEPVTVTEDFARAMRGAAGADAPVPPVAAIGQRGGAEAHAPPLHPGGIPPGGGDAAPVHARLRRDHGHHRGLSRRDGGGVCRDAGLRPAAALARIHVFPYSRRKGTVADAMEGQVDEAVKHERAKRLIELGNRLERRFVQELVGTCQQVLFEQPAGEGLAEGYTGQYVRVRAGAVPGQIARVRLERAEGTLALGTVVQDE